MSAHARLSPSSSERWLNCPGSIRGLVHVPGVGSSYAEEGTSAHAVLETCLRFECSPEDLVGVHFHDRNLEGDESGLGIIEAVGHALDWVRAYLARNRGAKLHIEFRVPSAALGREDCWGTSDIIIDDVEELIVADYKHGAGVVVSPENNSQLMIYAANFRAFMNRRWKKYRLVIIQPRARDEGGPIREWTITDKELDEFVERARKAAKATDAPDAPRVPGDYCRWCPARQTCRELAAHNLKIAAQEFGSLEAMADLTVKSKDGITLEELSYILRYEELIGAWLTDMRAYAADLLRRGQKIPGGWKLVQGKQGNRQWATNDAKEITQLLLRKGVTLDDIAPREPLSPTQAEKVYKRMKLDFQALAEHITRAPGSIHLAPGSDPRREIKPAEVEFKPLD